MRKLLFAMVIVLSFILISEGSVIDRIRDLATVTAEWINSKKLSTREAMWYRKIADGSVQCQLCPFNCIIKKGGRGICGVRANLDGKLVALTYSRPVAVHIDPIEKKPLFHFQPQSKSFSVATVGCNLSCNFCQNWTISQALPEDVTPEIMTPQEVVDYALKTGCKSISYTYSEPTVFYEYMYDTGLLAHRAGLKNVWVTCGYINEAPLRQLCEVIDAANVDIKGPESFYNKFTKSSLKPVLRTCRILREQGVWLEITMLIIPGANDFPDSVRALCKWIKDSLGPDVPVHFSRFHPNYKLTDRPSTPTETLTRFRKMAQDLGLLYVYTGNVPGDPGEDTYCPKTGEVIIDRTGFSVNQIKIDSTGVFRKSGIKIPGVWK